jgi:hypothetical protein
MTNLPQILHLVDSIEYAETNCFQHQLTYALRQIDNVHVHTLPLAALRETNLSYELIVCCLKQRTLHRELELLKACIGNRPVVVYDQDPWHAYMDDSPYKGVYHRAAAMLNIKTFAVTTRCWARRIQDDGLPATFTPMWVLPDYCNQFPPYLDRNISVGFIGSLHNYRQKFFKQLEAAGIQINVIGGNKLSYANYMRALSNIRVFIHNEDLPININGQEANLKDALWIKDVEAAARGCFTIRNHGVDAESYYEGIETTLLYNNIDEISELLAAIDDMNLVERQAKIDRSVEFIRRSNKWLETARTLIDAGSN